MMAEPTPSEKPAILLVDDVPANLLALEAQLDDLDLDLHRANNGNEALRLLLKRDFAVILLDVQMPEMDGFEVARYARENPATRDIPIVFVTALHESRENLQRGYGSGAVDLLFKPVDPYILRSKVKIFVDLFLARQRLNQEIQAHKRTLAEVEAFNYSVSHDLRAPLRALDGFSQVLLEEYAGKLDVQGKDYLGRIRAAAQRMALLIDDLLKLSKVSRSQVRRQSVDVGALARAVAEELRQSEPSRSVEFVCNGGPTIQADPGLTRIILENLLRNAWKFTRKNPAARVELTQLETPTGTDFVVHDNGVGFNASLASGLGKPFHRLHSGNEFEGTGIGLAIVERIVLHHGGRFTPDGAPNQGATFTFSLAPSRSRPSLEAR